MKIKMLVNNCGDDGSMFATEILAEANAFGKLPAELEDVFTLTIIEVKGETRAILNWKEN